MRAKAFPPKQVRSHATLNRLLAATGRIIDRHGLEGATVGRIAKEARLSTMVVYRRFQDKDALLESVFLHMMATQEQTLEQLTDVQLLDGLPLAEFTGRTFEAAVRAYRARGRFLSAARQFAHTRGSAAFRKRVERFEVRAFQHAIGLMLQRRDEISHPRPTQAVALGLLTALSAIRELSTWTSDEWRALFPSEDQLAVELTKAYLAYLTTTVGLR